MKIPLTSAKQRNMLFLCLYFIQLLEKVRLVNFSIVNILIKVCRIGIPFFFKYYK